MEKITVSIPDKLKKELDEFPEINWAAYLRERFLIKLKQLRKFEELVNMGKI